MRWTRTLILSVLLALPASLAQAANEIAVTPDNVKPGQTVTLRWYFTGDKIVVSGGRFGKGTVVTGRTSLTDTPSASTRYTFDVYYHAPAAADNKTTSAATANATPATEKPVHVRYTALAMVNGQYPTPAIVPGYQVYCASRGWQVCYLPGWKHDHVPAPGEGKDALVFFQKEDDSVERLAVAVLPTQMPDATNLLEQVKADIPSRYDKLRYLSEQECTFQDTKACRCIFEGADMSHPGTRTTTEMVCFVRDGRGFVVSTRTDAAHFMARRATLEKMLESFAITRRIPVSVHTAPTLAKAEKKTPAPQAANARPLSGGTTVRPDKIER